MWFLNNLNLLIVCNSILLTTIQSVIHVINLINFTNLFLLKPHVYTNSVVLLIIVCQFIDRFDILSNSFPQVNSLEAHLTMRIPNLFPNLMLRILQLQCHIDPISQICLIKNDISISLKHLVCFIGIIRDQSHFFSNFVNRLA